MLDQYQKRFIKIVESLSYGRSNVFRDFCEMAAIALANSLQLNTGGLLDKFAPPEAVERERRYLQIVKQYKKEELGNFSEMLACVVNSLSLPSSQSPNPMKDGFNFHDCLGELHMSDEITGRSKWDSDVAFTPNEISYMMAKMTFVNFKMPAKGYVTVGEPACGGGSMVIAACHALKDLGINFQQQMHVVATEIRPMLAHMAYIQFSLLHIPAIVIHGDTLAMKTFSVWKTPAHIFGLWDARLKRDYVAPQPQIEQAIRVGPLLAQAAFDFQMPAKENENARQNASRSAVRPNLEHGSRKTSRPGKRLARKA